MSAVLEGDRAMRTNEPDRAPEHGGARGHSAGDPHSHGAPTWFERPRTVRRIVVALYGACALLLIVDPLIDKHGPFAIERWWGFYAIYGFVGCVFLVLAAKQLRRVLMRSEDYYDR